MAAILKHSPDELKVKFRGDLMTPMMKISRDNLPGYGDMTVAFNESKSQISSTNPKHRNNRF